MEYSVKIIKSKRKSIGIEIKPDLSVLVRAPYFVSDQAVKKLLAEKNNWIEKKLSELNIKNKNSLPPFTKEELENLRQRTKEIIIPKTEYFSKVIGVYYNRLSVKKQKSVWGSCSAMGNINYNLLLCLCPDYAVDYIVVHELCHLKQLNHSKLFWAEVEKTLPEYKKARLWLKTEGRELIKRLPV